MKKNKGLTVLMVAVVLAALIFCIKTVRKDDKQTLTVTDPDGITYLAVLDQNNNVYAGITDTAGNLYGARIGEDGYPVLDESLYVIGDYDGTLPKNNTTVVNIQQSNSGQTYDYNADVSVVDDTTDSTTSAKNSDSAQTTEKEEKERMSEKYKTLFASGTYRMTFTTDDEDLPGEIELAMKNGSVYLQTTVEGFPAEVIYNDSTKSGAIVIKSFRVYCVLPDDMIDEFSSGALDINFSDSYKDFKSYKVSINGRECICESYTYPDGEVNNFYFYDNELVRLDAIGADGSSSIYNIISLSSDVSDSYFEMPKGYIKLDISKLLESEETE